MQSTVISASNSGEKKRYDSGFPGTYSLLGGRDNKKINKQTLYAL